MHINYTLSLSIIILSFCNNVFSQVFKEKKGVVLIETESIPAVGEWQHETDTPGEKLKTYIFWKGDEYFSDTRHGELNYRVKIRNPGIYQFKWYTRVGKGDNNTEHNDTWLKIEGVKDFYGKRPDGHIVRPGGTCTNDCPEGTSMNGFFKVYGAYHDSWAWHGSTSDHDPHDIFAWIEKPGIYTITLAARSSYHLIDKMLLFNTGMTSLENALPE